MHYIHIRQIFPQPLPIYTSMEIHQRYLVQAPPRTSTSNTLDALYAAIAENNAEGILEILTAVTTPERLQLLNSRNPRCRDLAPLPFALTKSCACAVVGLLLRAGAHPDRPATEPPLITAVRAGLVNCVKILLAFGANVNCLDRHGYTALHWACFRNNPLLARVILRAPLLSYHNLDRNPQRVSPLGIAINLRSIALVNELLHSPEVDLNLIDFHTKGSLYDLAAERGFYQACLSMEAAFISHHPALTALQLQRSFFDNHRVRIRGMLQHQLRNSLLRWDNDPTGPFTAFNDTQQRKYSLLPKNGPFQRDWIVLRKPESSDQHGRGWIYSMKRDKTSNLPYVVSLNGKTVSTSTCLLMNCIDNYRYRLLVSVEQGK